MNRLVKTRALVLRSLALGERDRLVVLFTLEKGKLSAVAPGARKIKSKLAAGVGLFTCGNYLLHMGKSMATVTQMEIEKSFIKIRENAVTYGYGMYFAELIDKLVEEGEANPGLFHLLFNGWLQLEKGQADRELLARYFELNLLDLLGYRPHLGGCLTCGNVKGPLYWHSGTGGILCSRCLPEGEAGYTISSGARALALGLLRLPPGKLTNLKIKEEQKRELKELLKQFLSYWTGVEKFKSLSFLENIT